MKKELPVLADFDYDRVGSFRYGNPYVIAFCYPKSENTYKGKGFVLKGGIKKVENRIHQIGFPMIVFLTFWRHGRCRWAPQGRFYNFKDFSVAQKKPFWTSDQTRKNKDTGREYIRRSALFYNGRVVKKMRRVPRKWIPLYDQLLMEPDLDPKPNRRRISKIFGG